MQTPKEVRFTIGVPLSINRTYGAANIKGKARIYKTKEATAWKDSVILIARSSSNAVGFQHDKTMKLALELRIFPPSMRSDTDGGLKLTQDGIAEGMGFNDRQIWQVHMYRVEVDKERPRCEVRLWILE